MVTPAKATPNSRARRDRLGDGERARREGEAAAGVDERRAAALAHDRRSRLAVGAAVAQVRRVLGDARDAVRGEPAGVGVDQRGGGGRGHVGIRAAARERALREVLQGVERKRRHRGLRQCAAASAAATLSAISVETRYVRLARDAGDVRREDEVRAARERRPGRQRLARRTRRARRRRACRTRSAAASAASSTMPPRAVLIRIASGFIVASRAASSRRASSSRQRHVQRHDVGRRRAASASGAARAARSAQTGASAARRRVAADHPQPSARAEPATARPMAPKPTMPSVLPASSRPRDSAARGHSPAATAAVAPYAPRSSSIAVPITYSATATVLAPVAGNHRDAARRAGGDVDVVEAHAEAPDDPQRAARPRAARASTCVRLRTISASASASRAFSSVAPVDQVPVVERGVLRGERATAASSMNSVMTTRIGSGYAFFANSWSMSPNALNSSALPNGSRKNIVACSPGSPLKRTYGSMTKCVPAARQRVGSAVPRGQVEDDAEVAHRHALAVDLARRLGHLRGATLCATIWWP